MSLKSHTKKLRQCLDAFSKAKADEERCKQLLMMKVFVELLEKPLKKRRNRKRMAYDKRTRIIKKALKQFFAVLDKIYAKHGELGDSAVRDKMYAAILKSFIAPEKAYLLPERFGMFCEEADGLVRAAIQQFLQHPEVDAARRLLKNANERLHAFQDDDVKTSKGTDFCEFFGYRVRP
jgi:hypothetical protein